jgi:recombination protein RecT
MRTSNQQGLISKSATQRPATPQEQAKKGIAALVGDMLDQEGYRKRFNELLGARAPQFISSIVSLINAEPGLQKVFTQAPITIIQSALKAATYDLPIDPSLGYAYIVPFNNNKKLPGGGYQKRMEAAFVMGYKGMNQLALRTGAYRTINVIDVREGELKSYNRLTEEIEIEFVEDEDAREKLPIVGWCGYFKLVNGTEKTIYMTRKQVEAHERKFRKGEYMGKGWREDFDNMAAKTVFRRLIGKWGLMSIDYRQADQATIAAADAIARGQFDDEDSGVGAEFSEVPEGVDIETGELTGDAPEAPSEGIDDKGTPWNPAAEK